MIKGDPHVGVQGTSFVKISSPSIEIGEGEIIIHGSKIVLSAGGGQITIGGAGVDIVGGMVRIN